MPKHRPLFVEALEKRAMLAGKVWVSVSEGTLFITGSDDNAGNGVSVQQLDGGKYFVTGFNVAGAETIINGTLGGKIFSGVTNDINVNLKGGPDVFVMSNRASRRAELAAELSDGQAGPIEPSPEAPNLDVDPGLTRVPRNLIVTMKDGNDGVGFTARVGSNDQHGGAQFGGVANLKTGGGLDRVIVKNSTIFDDLLIDTGSGADKVNITSTGTYDFLYAALGQGWDTFQSSNDWGFHSQIYGGDGNDLISVTNYNFNQEVFLQGGEGNNIVNATNMNAGGRVFVGGLAGQDVVNLTRCSSHANFHVDLGQNDDNVTLDNVDVMGTLSVYLGSGNDDLDVANSATGDPYFDGGVGFDNYDDNGGNTLGSPRIVNFES